MSEHKNDPPLQTLRDGAVVVKLWRQESKNGPFVSATVGRTYRNEETGEYGESRSLSGTDLLKAHALMLEAHKECVLWREHFRETEPQQNTPAPETGLERQRDAAMAGAKPRKRAVRAKERPRER